MDLDLVCVDDGRAVVRRTQNRAGEGRGYARLGDRECARTCLVVRMGGVHTACDGSCQTVPVDGAEARTSHSDPHNHVAHDGSPGICHRLLSEPWTSAVSFSHHWSWRAPISLAVRSQCSLYELYRHAYVLVNCGTVSVDPLLPGCYGAPDYSGTTGDAALPC
jgi:hypothetical protein